MIVVDASAVVELVLDLPLRRAVAAAIDDAEATLHAPQVLPLEVLSVLRRRLAAGQLDESAARVALRDLELLDIELHDHLLLTQRVWGLRDNLTSYDAAYVALAELLDATLVTCDAHLARAPGNGASTVLVGHTPST